MPFDPNLVNEFVKATKEENQATIRDLLSSPEKLQNYVESHHKANEEAKQSRHNLSALMKATGIELTASEQAEVSNAIAYINENGFDPERYAEVVESYGASEYIESGEIDPSEIGLIHDEETGEILVDQDDGEVYTDSKGNLVNGNGYYVDEDNNLVDEPINAEDVEQGSLDRIAETRLDEIRAEREALEAEKAQVALERKLIAHGVDPAKAEKFSRIYDEFETEDGSEPTEEQITEHFTKQKSEYPSFFTGAAQPVIGVGGGRINAMSVNEQQTKYEAAKSKASVQEMLATNTKYKLNTSIETKE